MALWLYDHVATRLFLIRYILALRYISMLLPSFFSQKERGIFSNMETCFFLSICIFQQCLFNFSTDIYKIVIIT